MDIFHLKEVFRMTGFMIFIREQGVVGLAVGFILGGAVAALTTALVESFFDPILGLILGAQNLSEYTIQIGSVELLVGYFLTVLMDFLVIAAVVYFGVKGLGLDKLDKKKK